MATKSSKPVRTIKRHPPPPLPSRLKPAQYAKLSKLVGTTSAETSPFFRACRSRLAASAYGEFSVDDLIDEALLRLFLGELPGGMKFPTKYPELIAAVERLGKLHSENASRQHRNHGPRPVSLDDLLHPDIVAQATSKQSTSLQTMQLDILRRLEDQLFKRIAQIESSNKPSKTDSEGPIESEIELF